MSAQGKGQGQAAQGWKSQEVRWKGLLPSTAQTTVAVPILGAHLSKNYSRRVLTWKHSHRCDTIEECIDLRKTLPTSRILYFGKKTQLLEAQSLSSVH